MGTIRVRFIIVALVVSFFAVGMAAFLIQHPDKEKDWVAVQAAGVESVLRAYQSLLRKDKSARVAALDDLVEERKTGDLRAVVKDEMKQCDPESMGAPPRAA